jgi:BCCT, betaine/carnitine/choline family transporter
LTGHEDHHWFQLCFWAVAIGAVASALLKAGGPEALKAVQAISIIISLPFNILALYAMQSIYMFCVKAEADKGDGQNQDRDPDLDFGSGEREFATPVYGGVFNLVEYIVSLGRVHKDRIEHGMDKPSLFHLIEFVKGLLVPCWPMYQSLQVVYPRRRCENVLCCLVHSVLYYSWIGLQCARNSDIKGLALCLFVLTGVMLTLLRSSFRARYGLRSNVVGDMVSCTLLWPQVLMQFREVTLKEAEYDEAEKVDQHTDDDEDDKNNASNKSINNRSDKYNGSNSKQKKEKQQQRWAMDEAV